MKRWAFYLFIFIIAGYVFAQEADTVVMMEQAFNFKDAVDGGAAGQGAPVGTLVAWNQKGAVPAQGPPRERYRTHGFHADASQQQAKSPAPYCPHC